LSQGTPALIVRDARRSIRVAMVATPSGPMLRPDALAPILRVDVHHDSSSWYSLEAWGARVQVQVGSRLVRVGREVRQLAAAPVVSGGRLVVPLQVVSEVFPEFVPNTRWDAEARQLVVLSTDIAARRWFSGRPRRRGRLNSSRRRSSTTTACDARPPRRNTADSG
jgi:hypothetical protein